MELALKQRLIGAGVIIALGVVFIPMFLKGTGRSEIREIPTRPQPSAPLGSGLEIDQTIPLPPEMPASVELEKPAIPQETQVAAVDTKQVVEKEVVQKTAESKDSATPPLADGAVSESLRSWVVQIASFTSGDKAVAFRDKLRKQGFNAFVEDSVTDDKRKVFRVRVGPLLERKQAEEILVKLQKKTKLKGFISKHP